MNLFESIVNIWGSTPTSQPVSNSDKDVRSASSEPRPQNTVNIAELESKISTQINRHRNSLGLKLVEKISQLDRIALEHSKSMKRLDRLSHDGARERHSQVIRTGLETGFGENCARGECEESEFLEEFDLLVPGWIKSSGHKQVLETAAFTHTGIGFAVKKEGSRVYYYATQIFAA